MQKKERRRMCLVRTNYKISHEMPNNGKRSHFDFGASERVKEKKAKKEREQ
jgi:hypothetical protein